MGKQSKKTKKGKEKDKKAAKKKDKKSSKPSKKPKRAEKVKKNKKSKKTEEEEAIIDEAIKTIENLPAEDTTSSSNKKEEKDEKDEKKPPKKKKVDYLETLKRVVEVKNMKDVCINRLIAAREMLRNNKSNFCENMLGKIKMFGRNPETKEWKAPFKTDDYVFKLKRPMMKYANGCSVVLRYAYLLLLEECRKKLKDNLPESGLVGKEEIDAVFSGGSKHLQKQCKNLIATLKSFIKEI